MSNHRYRYALEQDGDYVILEKLEHTLHWREYTRWLVPGTQIEFDDHDPYRDWK